MKKRSLLIILFHIIYWTPAVVTITALTRSRYYHSPNNSGIIDTQILYIVEFVAFYIAYLMLFPLFVSKKKMGSFIGYSIITIVVASIAGGLFAYAMGNIHGTVRFDRPVLLTLPIKAISSIFMACVISGTIAWYTDLRYKQQLEKKNLETQLALLKAQINPHFLFNTLNNIDVLIEKDAKTASAYLQKLSGILRFMLYENTDEKIALTKELAYITQYIELQKIRTTNPDFVKFAIDGNTQNVLVYPMLFIPFIENAFKHSTNKKISNAIGISIMADARQVKFACTNAYDEAITNAQEQGGLGLELIGNRLDLLYPGKHQLDISKTNQQFTVNLSINLA